MVCVGIDVAKDKHDCCILDSDGTIRADCITIPNNMDGFKQLLQTIRDCTKVYGNEPPTYACVGDRDYIADERVMRWRIETIRSQGTPAEIEVFPGLAHGFGLGTGTSAEGWLDHAVAFWEENT